MKQQYKKCSGSKIDILGWRKTNQTENDIRLKIINSNMRHYIYLCICVRTAFGEKIRDQALPANITFFIGKTDSPTSNKVYCYVIIFCVYLNKADVNI